MKFQHKMIVYWLLVYMIYSGFLLSTFLIVDNEPLRYACLLLSLIFYICASIIIFNAKPKHPLHDYKIRYNPDPTINNTISSVFVEEVMIPDKTFSTLKEALDALPPDGGIIYIGEEIHLMKKSKLQNSKPAK